MSLQECDMTLVQQLDLVLYSTQWAIFDLIWFLVYMIESISVWELANQKPSNNLFSIEENQKPWI